MNLAGEPDSYCKIGILVPQSKILASNWPMDNNAIFGERYRVIAIDDQNLVLRGIRSGDVLTIKNADPENPLSEADYPPGKLIAARPSSTETQS